MAFGRSRGARRPKHRPEAIERFQLGRSLAAEGRLNEAAECYRAALEIEPDFAEAVVNLGIAYGQLGPEWADEQLRCLRRGAELNPDSARTHYNLGVACARRKDLSGEAIAAFERALAIDPMHRNALYALSVLWSRRGDRARARELHERYRLAMGEPLRAPAASERDEVAASGPGAHAMLRVGEVAAPLRAAAADRPLEAAAERPSPPRAEPAAELAAPAPPAAGSGPRLRIRFVR